MSRMAASVAGVALVWVAAQSAAFGDVAGAMVGSAAETQGGASPMTATSGEYVGHLEPLSGELNFDFPDSTARVALPRYPYPCASACATMLVAAPTDIAITVLDRDSLLVANFEFKSVPRGGFLIDVDGPGLERDFRWVQVSVGDKKIGPAQPAYFGPK